MHAAPMASRAKTKKHTSKVTTDTPKHAGIPCAMALTTYPTLFPAIGLFVTVIGAMRKHRRQLDASVETSSARFPKFVHPRGIFPRELRKGKGTSKFKIPVPLTI
jgi:hypothetical protein